MLVPSLLWAHQAKSTAWPIEIFEVMDDSRIIIFIKDDDIATSPVWHPAEGGPPMSIAVLLTKVNKWIAEDPRLKGFGVHEIELKPINHHKDHWYYLVQLKPEKNGKKKPSYIAVLLNGKVVPAMVKPASIK